MIYTKELDDWIISWESIGNYRLWCKQEHASNTDTALVVMFNPGALSGAGENLNADTTLRILREIFIGSGYNPYIVNLFTLATAKPSMLFDNWEIRDCPNHSIEKLSIKDFSAVMYAYGAYELVNEYSEDILNRIEFFRNHFEVLPEIELPTSNTDTPMHPIRIQIEGLKNHFKSIITQHFGANHLT